MFCLLHWFRSWLWVLLPLFQLATPSYEDRLMWLIVTVHINLGYLLQGLVTGY